MKTYSFRSLSDFKSCFDLTAIDQNTLIISDIDGVFFKGILDPREIVGILEKGSLLVLETLLKRKPAIWLFTNRLSIFKRFRFVRQFRTTMQNFTDKELRIFKGSKSFVEQDLVRYALILNARKPGKDSQKVVEKGIENFKKVIYIGAKDLPFYFTDEKLLAIIERNKNLDNLTFIKISPF
ncbi:MAG: hypothetical protein PHS44_03915 [Candidatus Dojkabacteria bacterium]|nr:hypothetical protein [Candidatus Dojkabacteria bacterium]